MFSEFSHFHSLLSIVCIVDSSSNDSIYSIAFKEIRESTTILGKYGIYFKKQGSWYHLRWFVEGFCVWLSGTYSENTTWKSEFRSAVSLVWHNRHFYSPLLNDLIPTTWSQLFDSSHFKVVDSSMNQLHPASLYRLSSMIGGIVTSRANRMISDGIGEYFDSISIEQFKEPFNVTLCFCKLFLNETNLL